MTDLWFDTFNDQIINDHVKAFLSFLEDKEKIAKRVSFDFVKSQENYFVPQLNSYDTLEEIYRNENHTEKLHWLHNIGQHIGYQSEYQKKQPQENVKPKNIKTETFDFSAITRKIQVPKSNQKGKLGFLNSLNQPCSTEEAFKDYTEQLGWKVMRAEVDFWQAMFCLSFWEEIFKGMLQRPNWNWMLLDIPIDLFAGHIFYLYRKRPIDLKYKSIKQHNLFEFINEQIQRVNVSTRLLHNGDRDLLDYSKSQIVQDFLKKISPSMFAKIVYRIAQNPNENRSGVPDFVIWNPQELFMVEVKRIGESIRKNQKIWLEWLLKQNIPTQIVRIQGT